MTTEWRSSRVPGYVVAVLFVALALRLFLVARGGDYYWADEQRYEAALRATHALCDGNFGEMRRALFSTSGHIGFRWLAVIPALIDRAIFHGKTSDARICAAFFAFFSVANLYLVWRIARRFATSEWEPALALAFVACSNALFFQVRHCFPYDAALTFLLLAVYISTGPAQRWQAARVGLCCGIGYLTYNGYWSVGAVILIFEVLWRRETWLGRVQRAALGFAGLVAPLVVVFGAARLAGFDLISDSIAFADTVNQGDFGEGWRFPAEYLWVVDGALWIVAGVAIVAGSALCVARREFAPWLRWVAMAGLLYAVWVVFCDVIPKFVLYGRTVRAAMPFLALGAAGALEMLRLRGGPVIGRLGLGAAALGCAGGLGMMLTPLQQRFPRDFHREAERRMAEVRQREPNAVLQTMFDDYLSSPNFPEAPPPHRELLRRRHPHQYLPYLYEGYTREQRPLYYKRDIAMRLIQLDTHRGLQVFKRAETSRDLGPYSGPLSLFVRLPSDAVGRREFLLEAGRSPEKRDRIVVEYLDASHVRLGVSRGRDLHLRSEPIACDFGTDHAIGVWLGALLPPPGDPLYAKMPTLQAASDRVSITFDGQEIFVGRCEGEPTPIAELRLGATIPAEGETQPFSGQLHSVRQVDPRLFSGERPPGRPVAIESAYFGECQGALEIRFRFPKNAISGAQPLMASGHPGEGDLLYVSYQSHRHVRLHMDHWGTPSIQSEVVEVDPDAVQRLVVSFGSLYPQIKDARYRSAPQLRKLTEWLYVSLNGQVVFSRPADFYAVDPEEVAFGVSIPGSTACEPRFAGEILQIKRIPPESVLPAGTELPQR